MFEGTAAIAGGVLYVGGLGGDFYALDLADGKVTINGHVPAGYVYVAGQTVGGLEEESLKDRRMLSTEGVISAVVVIDIETGDLLGAPTSLRLPRHIAEPAVATRGRQQQLDLVVVAQRTY